MVFGPVLGAGIQSPVIVVGYGHNSGAQRNIYAFETLGVTGAVPVFVMMENNLDYMTELRKIFQHTKTG